MDAHTYTYENAGVSLTTKRTKKVESLLELYPEIVPLWWGATYSLQRTPSARLYTYFFFPFVEGLISSRTESILEIQ